MLSVVTVIIPAKNEERHINDCLTGVLDQTYPSDLYRIVVVDNGSTDNTVSIVKGFEKTDRVRLIVKEKGTIAAVRNFGASFAKSRYIAFLDGDCVPARNWLETGIRLLQGVNQAGCVGFVGLPPGVEASWIERTWQHLCSTWRVHGSTTVSWLSSFNLIIQKDLFDKIGGFDPGLPTCEDVDLGHRLSGLTKLILSDETTVCHLDEPTTLRRFFLKELWRGKSGLKALFRSRHKKYDFPSVAVPVAYFSASMIGCAAALSHFVMPRQVLRDIAIVCLAVIIMVPIMNVFYKTRRLLGPSQIVMSYFLSTIYLIARGLAIVWRGR